MNKLFDLIVNVVGIYVCYVYYAILQEKLTTKKGGHTVPLTQTLFLMLVQCCVNCVCIAPIVIAERINQTTQRKPQPHPQPQPQHHLQPQQQQQQQLQQSQPHDTTDTTKLTTAKVTTATTTPINTEPNLSHAHAHAHTHARMPEYLYATMALTYLGGTHSFIHSTASYYSFTSF